MTERVTVTSDAELEVDPAVMIVGPCTVLVLEDVDSCVFIRLSKSSIPVKRIPPQIHVTNKSWANCLDGLPIDGLGLIGGLGYLEYKWP